jgi:hypothetical protein
VEVGQRIDRQGALDVADDARHRGDRAVQRARRAAASRALLHAGIAAREAGRAGKSEADYAAADERDRATLGDAFNAIQMRALAITRKYETHSGYLRPDLSYPPMAMK